MRRFALLILVANFLIPALSAQATPAPTVLGRNDAVTLSGFDHLYNLEYDQSIADFDQIVKQRPEDPFALNHLLEAILLKELYRLNALDTTLYADDGFLTKI